MRYQRNRDDETNYYTDKAYDTYRDYGDRGLVRDLESERNGARRTNNAIQRCEKMRGGRDNDMQAVTDGRGVTDRTMVGTSDQRKIQQSRVSKLDRLSATV